MYFQNSNTEFCQHKASNTTGAQRETLLKDLASGFDAFMDLKGNLEEGTKVTIATELQYSSCEVSGLTLAQNLL